MVAIKLRPVGKKKQHSYRVVVAPKRSKLVGKSIEDLGWYNPHTDLFSINKERAQYWISQGAQPTDSIHNILVNAKIIEGKKRAMHGKGEPKAPVAAPVTPTEQKQVEGSEVVEPVPASNDQVVEQAIEEAPAESQENAGAQAAPAQEEKSEEPTTE